MGQTFDDYPGFQPMRSWANTYAQDCNQNEIIAPFTLGGGRTFGLQTQHIKDVFNLKDVY